MEEFAALMAKGYSCVTEKNVAEKKSQRHKKVCHEKHLDLKTINIA